MTAGQRYTADDLRTLPTTVDLRTASAFLGVGSTLGYQMVKDGTWPTRVLRMGRLIRIPTADLINLLDASGGETP